MAEEERETEATPTGGRGLRRSEQVRGRHAGEMQEAVQNGSEVAPRLRGKVCNEAAIWVAPEP